MRNAALLVPVLICSIGWASDRAADVFKKRLDSYVKLRRELAGKLPRLGKKAAPEEIERHDRALAESIRQARQGARQGDVFAPETKPLFITIFKQELRGAQNRDARTAVTKDGNPAQEKAPGEVTPVVQVNAKYPENAPLSTVPPSLLLRLPTLPKDIEYRFVGRTLLLRDAQSDLIIDYLPEAVPKP